ncbi:hypothetical protein Scep_029227 [Stephania cephalantha]|uniref:SS18 N-terminal domain-containing protein n=1 Tax=Stephania cephalantha TaxID=152367 RepID=A0AAP0HFL6_9MAGN
MGCDLLKSGGKSSLTFICFIAWYVQYLDENKKLILAILDNQNLGKLAECAQYQAQLQKNLMYLAAIADAQPQVTPPQVPQHTLMQQSGHYMQHPQAALAQQAGGFPPKVGMPYTQQQLQEHHQQQLQQQAMQGHMGTRPGINNGMHPMHFDANLGGVSNVGSLSNAGLTDFSRGGTNASPSAGAGGAGISSGLSLDARGSKQDGAETGSGDAPGNSAAGHSGTNGEPSYMKGSEDAN